MGKKSNSTSQLSATGRANLFRSLFALVNRSRSVALCCSVSQSINQSINQFVICPVICRLSLEFYFHQEQPIYIFLF